jgi:hypothetical protein
MNGRSRTINMDTGVYRGLHHWRRRSSTICSVLCGYNLCFQTVLFVESSTGFFLLLFIFLFFINLHHFRPSQEHAGLRFFNLFLTNQFIYVLIYVLSCRLDYLYREKYLILVWLLEDKASLLSLDLCTIW